jgi:hypothetical protein
MEFEGDNDEYGNAGCALICCLWIVKNVYCKNAPTGIKVLKK